MKNVMKLKCLAAAIMAFGASGAFAVTAPLACNTADAATTVNTCTPDIVLYVGGASALGGAITSVLPADLLDATAPGGITKVAGGAGVPNASATSAWYGTAKSTLGTAAGKKMFVVYNNQNGSAAGISQLLSPIKDTTIPEQDVVTMGPKDSKGVIALLQTKAATANDCTLGSDSTSGGVTYHNVTCTSHARTQMDIGFSDVRPDMLFALEGAKPKALTTLTYYPIANQSFGVAVNNKLYKTLQAKQFAEGTCGITSVSGVPTVTTLDTTVACQPSIRKADYASLISTEGSIKSAAALLGDATDTTMLVLARRDDLSGTQASSNVFFADNPCGRSLDSKGKAIKGVVGGMLSILATTPDAAKLTVHLNATSGLVKSDLAGTTASPTDYVIGVVSLDSAEPARADTDASWKYVKIDGQSPNFKASGSLDTNQRDSSINGNYPFVVASYAAVPIKPFSKTSAVTVYPSLVTALIGTPGDTLGGFKDSTLHNLRGIGYLDGAAEPSALEGAYKQAQYIRRLGNSCSPLIKK